MEFEEFSEYICRYLEAFFEKKGEKVSVYKKGIMKNNGLRLTAVTVCRRDYDVSPTIYVENYYNQYKNIKNLDMVMKMVCEAFEDNMYEMKIDVNAYCDFDLAKENIVFRLINRNMNKKKLENMPHLPYKDLAVTFRWVVHMDGECISSAPISNSDMTRWNTDVHTLYALARKNTMRMLPLNIETLFDMLSRKYNMNEFGDITNSKMQLFIITNNMGINGAAAILYDEALQKCADRAGGNIYILPSSIHEMLFVSAEGVDNPEDLRDLIKDANIHVLPKSDILSDNLYYYDCSNKTLDIVH